MSDTRVEVGSRVTMHYTLSLEDGTEVDSSRDHEPLNFTLGDGSLIAGLESFLLGLQAGDEYEFTVAPEQAFGFPEPENIHELPRDGFPPGPALEPGSIMSFSLPSGDEIPGRIMTVDEARVHVDFNHPLAGHTLSFAIEILSVE